MSLAWKKNDFFCFSCEPFFFGVIVICTMKPWRFLKRGKFCWWFIIHDSFWSIFHWKRFEYFLKASSELFSRNWMKLEWKKMFAHWLNLKTRFMGAGGEALMEDKIDKKIISNWNNRSGKLLHNHFASAQFYSFFCFPFEWCEPSQ